MSVVTDAEHHGGAAPRLPAPPRLAVLSARRRSAGFAVALAGLPLLTAGLLALRLHVQLSSVLLLYLSLTVAVAAIGGIWPGGFSALAGSVLANWYFTPPLFTWTVNNVEDAVALVVFVVVASVVSLLTDLVARRAAEAARGRAESAALARLASTVLDSDNPLPTLVQDLQATFGLDAVAILCRRGDDWAVETAAGRPIPDSPERGTDVLDLGDDTVLVLDGSRAPVDDQRILTAFAAQLAIAVANRALRAEAAEAKAQAAANRLRSALLSAVSHDLRTPLASIKAAATSLLQDDVELTSRHTTGFARSIVHDTDRLNRLVSNLLDMSRIRAGALEASCRPVELEELVPAALAGAARVPPVVIDVADTLPRVLADPALLERVVANVVDNAQRWSPPGTPIRVRATASPGHVALRVIDRGPGIPEEARERVCEPFQRLNDSNQAGVGLGLAIARGFTEAMSAELRFEETPGGGTTVVVGLKAAP